MKSVRIKTKLDRVRLFTPFSISSILIFPLKTLVKIEIDFAVQNENANPTTECKEIGNANSNQ